MILPVHPLEDTWGKATCKALKGKRFNLFRYLETRLCKRSEEGPTGNHDTWYKVGGALEVMEMADSVRDVGASGKPQGRGPRGRLPGGSSFSV